MRRSSIRDPASRVRKLAEIGCSYDVEIGINIKLYLRCGRVLLQNIEQHINDGQIEEAFILATKFSTIFIEKLPKHPDYKSLNQTERKEWADKARKVLPKAEKLKKFLLQEYTKEEEERQHRETELENERKRKEEELKKQQEKEWMDEQERRAEEEERQRVLAAATAAEAALANVKQYSHTPEPCAPPPPYEEHVKSHPKPSAPPFIDRSNKPVSRTDSSQVGVLKSLVVPERLMLGFMKLAQPNTQRNIETCGILCGHLNNHKYFITHLVIPKQSGTPDSCTTQNEEEVFDIIDQEGLVTLGWIHTHPSQTAFLSSVDLHTQLSYQIMMPEAIAIVCAPKYNDVGFFSLTADHGLKFILNCKASGFHPHPENPPLFEHSSHVIVESSRDITIRDLRR